MFNESPRRRAVSDLVGFTLMFSLIIASVGVLYVGGFGALTDMRGYERTAGAERSFDTLAANFDSMARGDPARSSEIRLDGGSLSVEDDVQIELFVDGARIATLDPRTLVYASDQTNIRYEAGGVFREEDGYGYTISGPTLSCTSDRAVVSVLELRPVRRSSVSRDGSVVVTGRVVDRELLFPADVDDGTTDATSVSVEVSGTENVDAWKQYLEADGWTASGDRHVCDVGADGAVLVRTTVAELRFL
jgi:hypothetical protein